jgi:hypothetical protein
MLYVHSMLPCRYFGFWLFYIAAITLPWSTKFELSSQQQNILQYLGMTGGSIIVLTINILRNGVNVQNHAPGTRVS